MMNVLIIISKLFVGGFARSLINFLVCMQQNTDIQITLLMLDADDSDSELEQDIPESVRIIKAPKPVYRKHSLYDVKEFYYHYRYVFWEYYHKLIRHQSIPLKYVREYAQVKQCQKSKKLLNDYSHAEQYDAVISWEETFCNYVVVDHFPVQNKIGYIHPNYVEAQFSKRIDRPYLKRLNRIVTISSFCCDTLKQVFPQYSDKIVYIPNRLSKAYYDDLSERYRPNVERGDLTLLTVARIVDFHKAVFRIVDLTKRLTENGCRIKWYIIGDGPDLQELKERIQKNNLGESVICLGVMTNPYPYMKIADLYVQQSHYEGRPVSVDESMLLGTPALVTNYSSAHEQVDDGINGWIVQDEEKAIFDQLLYLVKHPDEIIQAKKNLASRSNDEFEDCSAMIEMLKSLKE